MKRIKDEWKRKLSFLLSAVMVLGSVPGQVPGVYAAGNPEGRMLAEAAESAEEAPAEVEGELSEEALEEAEGESYEEALTEDEAAPAEDVLAEEELSEEEGGALEVAYRSSEPVASPGLAEGEIRYVDRAWDKEHLMVVSENKSIKEYEPVLSLGDDLIWEDGWYVVSENALLNGTVTVSGNVGLILCDGTELEVKKGIVIGEKSELSIYEGSTAGEVEGSGKLSVWSGDDDKAGIEVPEAQESCLNIFGGVVDAAGTENGAAIGGGKDCAAGTVNIYGGTVTAMSEGKGAGIGGGLNGTGGNVFVYGGAVTARGSIENNSMAIGHGSGEGIFYNGSLIIKFGGVVYGGEDESSAEVVEEEDGNYYERHAYMRIEFDPQPLETVYFLENTYDAVKEEVTGSLREADRYYVVSDNTTSWTEGRIYVVTDDVEMDDEVSFRKEDDEERNPDPIRLILCDGATLKAPESIMTNGVPLYIYAGAFDENIEGSGELVSIGDETYPGIGDVEMFGCTIVIHGGIITAIGGSSGGAGIGDIAGAAVVTIYDGKVTATGGAGGAGIGGCAGVSSNSTSIYGGSVTATGGTGADGIGSGAGNDEKGLLTVGAHGIVYGGESSVSANVIEEVNGDYERFRFMHVHFLNSPIISYTAEDVDTIYDGTPHGLNIKVTEPSYGYSIRYAQSESDEYTLTQSPTITGVGEKTVHYEIKAQGYNTVKGSAVVKVRKAPITVTADDKKAVIGSRFDFSTLTATISGNYVASEVEDIKADLDIRVEGVSENDVVEYRSYSISVNWAEQGNSVSENYAATFVPGIFTGEKKTPTVSAPEAIAGLVYNKTAQQLVKEGSAVGGTIKYAVSENGVFTTDIPTAVSAGDYTVYYIVEGDEDYRDLGPEEVKVTIAASKIEIRAESISSNIGEPVKTPVDYTVSGDYYEGDELGVTLSTTVDETSPEGSYPITVSWNGNTDYDAKLTDGIYTLIGNLKPTLVTAPEAITGLVYTGQAQALVKAGTAEGGTVKYALSDNAVFDSRVPTAVDAGVYTVYYMVEGAEGYRDIEAVSISANIAKAAISDNKAPEAKKKLVYSGNAQELVTPGKTECGTYLYAIGEGEFNETIPTADKVGVYDVHFKVKGDKNHNDVDGAVISVKIDDSPMSIVPVIDDNTKELYLVKGQQFTLPTGGWTCDKNKYVSISKKGVIKAKKATNEPVTMKNAEGRTIDLYVSEPKMKKMRKLEAGTSAPANFTYDSEHFIVSWNSSTPGIATVSDNGVVYAHSKGTAVITACIRGKRYTCKVKVTESAAALERTIYLTVGQSKDVSLKKVKYKSWTIDDTSIASAKKKKIKAVAVGDTNARVVYNSKEYITHVYVENPTIKTNGNITAGKKNKYTVNMKTGETTKIEYECIKQAVFYKSSKPEIAYVTVGDTLVANKAGKTKVTAKINGKTVTLTVKVTD